MDKFEKHAERIERGIPIVINTIIWGSALLVIVYVIYTLAPYALAFTPYLVMSIGITLVLLALSWVAGLIEEKVWPERVPTKKRNSTE